jgi:hypothetical protein
MGGCRELVEQGDGIGVSPERRSTAKQLDLKKNRVMMALTD